ncbi:hypothetical protein LNP74_17675 [Klebsiella pneumoniae subsp. pneumoniae]|nr:hypothetical protein [Klebsiella pneumoniae subsp. pneumoniae]
MKALREPLWWLIALFIGLLAGLPYSAPLFSRLFPELPRPVYQQESSGRSLSITAGWWWRPASRQTAIGGWGWRSPGPPAARFVRWWRPSPLSGRPFPPVAVAGDGGAGAGLWLAAGADSPRAVWHTAGAAGGRWPGWVRYRLGCQAWLKGWE